MGLVPTLQQIQTGDADAPSRDMSNWNAIRDVVNGGIDNNNISSSAAIAISKTELATFTNWTDYTPTYDASESMTFTSVTSFIARYIRIGDMVALQVTATGTTGGTASNSLTFTLPITAAASGTNVLQGGASIKTTSTTRSSGFFFSSDTSTIVVRKYDDSNFALGSNIGFGVQMIYEV